MIDFILDFDDFAHDLYWYWLDSFELIVEELMVLMGSIQNTVYHCCVAKGGRILYSYSGGDHEIENLTALCVERAPPYHKWYFQTVSKRTYGFLMEDGYVYFAIVDAGLGNSGVLRFLEHVRDDFKKLIKKGLKGSRSNLNSICFQEQLLPVIRQLISSLEQVSQTGSDWMSDNCVGDHVDTSFSQGNSSEGMEGAGSTKAPLLGKSGKHDKKSKEHVIAIKDVEFEEHRKSTDRGFRNELDSNNQGGGISSISLQRDGSLRRTSSQSFRKKWCRQVRIILAIDAAICIILFGIWLAVCQGFECIRS
ncbi:hypothetical protein Ancab_036335 [Ancistrocladus abbreviatus]